MREKKDRVPGKQFLSHPDRGGWNPECLLWLPGLSRIWEKELGGLGGYLEGTWRPLGGEDQITEIPYDKKT